MKYTKAIHNRIVKLVREGVDVSVICKMNRISRTTFYNWIAKGQAGEEPFKTLIEDLEKADAELEAELTGHLVAAGRDGKWQASATYLERRKSDRWGRNNTLKVETLQRPEVVEAESLPTDVLIAEYRKLGSGDDENDE